jgi:hypothetical protein
VAARFKAAARDLPTADFGSFRMYAAASLSVTIGRPVRRFDRLVGKVQMKLLTKIKEIVKPQLDRDAVILS